MKTISITIKEKEIKRLKSRMKDGDLMARIKGTHIDCTPFRMGVRQDQNNSRTDGPKYPPSVEKFFSHSWGVYVCRNLGLDYHISTEQTLVDNIGIEFNGALTAFRKVLGEESTYFYLRDIMEVGNALVLDLKDLIDEFPFIQYSFQEDDLKGIMEYKCRPTNFKERASRSSLAEKRKRVISQACEVNPKGDWGSPS